MCSSSATSRREAATATARQARRRGLSSSSSSLSSSTTAGNIDRSNSDGSSQRQPTTAPLRSLGDEVEPDMHHSEAAFKKRYAPGRVLGCGSFSTVRLVTDRATGKEWACKVVSAEEEAERAVLLREVDILRQLDHPNVVRYREHFDIPDGRLVIITELLEGTDLLSVVVQRGSLSEDEARGVTRQVLSALAYLHSKGVAHRDLSPENIMLTRVGDQIRIKIIDFGLADQLSSGKAAFRDACGTPTHVAPEVASCVPYYGTKCDVWAAGVTLFMMLSGSCPFYGRSVSELLTKIRSAKICFADPEWAVTSATAKDLVRALLAADPAVRPVAEEALAHPWLSH